ncbi:FISUMP domain-containing protein [Parabacteroides sp. APC149_11_2_Y6]
MNTKLQGLCPSCRPLQALAASAYLLAAVLLASSCTAESDKTDRTPVDGTGSANKREVLLSFKNKLTVATTKSETKADAPIATKEENAISTLDIYVFASTDEAGTYTYRERFAYRPEGVALPAGANKLNLAVGTDDATTTALLELQKGMFVRLYCLANQTELVNTAGDKVEDTYFQPLEYTMETGNLVEGTPSETDFQKLHSPLLSATGTALNLPLPMVGSQTVPIDLTDFGSSARVQTGFKLTRTMARFDVSNMETDSKFHLESISMGNGRKGVSFFPVKVYGTSPAAGDDLITYPERAFEGDKANEGLQVSAFYSYPSPSADKGYLILKGTYQVNLTETKDVTYRIPFEQPTADGGSVALEINNNHRYTIGITKADEYHLDFTLDVAEWDEGGEIDGLDPTAGSGDFAFDPDGIANAATTFDETNKTVTMLLADDSKFSLSTTANSTMSCAIRYAGSNKNCDWLEVKEDPATKAVTASTISGTEHKYIISMKADYTGGIYPRGIIRFIDDATGKSNTLLVEALSFVPELTQSASDGTSSFADNKLTLKATSSVATPSVTLTVNCQGGSKLADFPEWMTVDKTESSNDEDTYKFEVKVDKDGFPTANPGEVTFKFRHKIDNLKELPVTLAIEDEPSLAITGGVTKDDDAKTLRINPTGGTRTFSIVIKSLFESTPVSSEYDVAYGTSQNWLTGTDATSIINNRRQYTYSGTVASASGSDAAYQAHKANLKISVPGQEVKEYGFYRSANTVTYPVSADKQYTAIQMAGKDGKTYYWSPVNLGATEIPTTVPSASSTAGGTNDITSTCGLLYQWGRQYGFTNTNNSDITNAEKFDGKTDPLGFPTGEGALADMSPWDKKFIVYSSSNPNTQYNWLLFTEGADNPSGSAMPDNAWYQKLWNLDEVANSSIVATTVRKTSSDPCPAGWRVPTAAEWQTIGADDSSTGKTWNSSTHLLTISAANSLQLILPAAGYRDGSNGSSNGQGSGGYYWSSSVPSSSTGARNVGFLSATFYQGTNDRASGFSVRCLQE